MTLEAEIHGRAPDTVELDVGFKTVVYSTKMSFHAIERGPEWVWAEHGLAAEGVELELGSSASRLRHVNY